MDETAFRARFANELTRLAEGHPGQRSDDLFRRAFELHRRHGIAVAEVFSRVASSETPDLGSRQSLEPTALVRLFLGTNGQMPDLSFSLKELIAEYDPTTAGIGANDGISEDVGIFPLRVRIEGFTPRPCITVIGLGELKGPRASVLFPMRLSLQADVAALRQPEQHELVATGALAAMLDWSKRQYAQYVLRCRTDLADYYAVFAEAEELAPLLIQTREQHGYRLDPTARFVARAKAFRPATVF